jgi:hypothetical protein
MGQRNWRQRAFAICFSSIAVLGCSSFAYGQAMPGASRPIEVQAGAGFSFASPDYGSEYAPYIKGITVYGDATYHRLMGIEAEVHYDSILTPDDIGENTYMIGPKVSFLHEQWVSMYAKGLGGLATFEYQPSTYPKPHSDSYGAFALGGGIELHVSPHIFIRAIDIEQQWWPGFSPHGLTPFVTTFGIAYGD